MLDHVSDADSLKHRAPSGSVWELSLHAER
jgi:hypothetical protein